VGDDIESFARTLRRVLIQARAMLAGTLKGVVSQRLVRAADGNGRVAVCEVLRMTGRVKDMTMNPSETGRCRMRSARAPTTLRLLRRRSRRRGAEYPR